VLSITKLIVIPGFCCTDCYHEAVSVASPSPDADVRLRTKYNAAVLRSRHLQKKINEQSMTSLPVSQPCRLDDGRHAAWDTAAHFRVPAAESHHRFASHAKESTHGATVASDCHHLQSKSVTNQTRSKTSAVPYRMHVGGNVIRTTDRSQCFGTHVNTTDGTDSKISTRINTGGAVASAVGIRSYPELPKMLPVYGNTRDIEMYATIPRNIRQRKTIQQRQPEVSDVPQQTFRSGIPHTSGNPYRPSNVSRTVDDHMYPEMSRRTRRQDEPSSPLHNSLPRLKISWSVTKQLLVLELSTFIKNT